MEQLALFEALIKDNKIWDAHTVGKNLYSKNLGNKDIFSKYFDFTCTVAGYPIEISKRKYFISEAETALVFYSENAMMDVEQLEYIRTCKEKVMAISQEIADLEENLRSKHHEKLISNNQTLLTELVNLKSKLRSVKTQDEFDDLLVKVNELENMILKELFTNEQKALYDMLTKDYSAIINEKMTELALLSNIEYNKKAVRDFKYVFDEFKRNEKKYINSQSLLYTLTANRLFSYDPGKLFNETLIYYNHVYSYLFSKLDDDGKFKLTQIAIDTDKLKR